ncbi:hypothetical protein RS9916_27734 [Synechococcus sp. RS9916]|nr:hypothetical protein RS9916_27734 [Synechococcus sp. RS9916]
MLASDRQQTKALVDGEGSSGNPAVGKPALDLVAAGVILKIGFAHGKTVVSG